MRFLVLFILLTVFFIGCAPTDNVIDDPDDNIVVVSSCQAIPTIKDLYRQDAERMALRQIKADPSNTWNDSIAIDPDLVRYILTGLLGVHNGLNMPYRDSVIAVYGIHSFEDIVLDRILIKVDENYNWVQQWKLGNQITGNSGIDNIMDKYDLSLDQYNQWSIGNFALVKSETSLNQFALAREFEQIAGVLNAQEDAVTGDGSDITFIDHPDEGDEFKEFIFSVGYQSCSAVCKKRRFFRFHVTKECRLEFRGSWGDEGP